MKTCACGQPAYQKGRVQDKLCRGCRSAKANEWNKENRDRKRDKNYKRKFGITLDTYEEMNRAQNGVCAICKETCITCRVLAVDHCHKTKKVRGLLCYSCNVGLGHFRETPAILYRAIEYLNAHTAG